MITGLIVGKFCPLHKGHEYLIKHASASCDRLIIISYTSKNYYPAYLREYWLKSIFPQAEVYILDDNCPFDDATEVEHRDFVAKYLKHTLYTSVDAVFGGDDYIVPFANYLASYFGQEVTPITINRQDINISGTQLRAYQDPLFLNPIVAQSLKPKIAILGGESAGKTTLTMALAYQHHEAPVIEYGRDFYDQVNGNLKLQDMLLIGKAQAFLEDFTPVNRYQFCDTTPLTTAFYSQVLFGVVDPKLQQLANRQYTRTFLIDPIQPFVQDGTRKDQNFQRKAFDFYKNTLRNTGIKHTIITGTRQQLIDQVNNEISSIQ